MSQPLDIQILWWLSTTIQLWIAWKIYRSDLIHSFRFFAVYMALSSASNIVISLVENLFTDPNYVGFCFLFWTYTSSLFEFLLIRELSTIALIRFPAIKAASGRTLTVFWGILIAFGGTWFYYLNSTPSQNTLAFLMPAIRYQEAVSLGFTLFILLFLAFVAWMPVPLSTNILKHAFLMGGYFLALTLSRFSVELGKFATQQRIADYVGLIGVIVVLAAWLARIKFVDSSSLATPHGPLDAAEAKLLLSRLEELNQSLSSSRSKVIR
ncbi:MAG: hypothetical protein FJW36_11135 [Acidobacteria bacterium]|nr:hypothetical protein [Acidobacteriota bacterium]